MVFDENLIQFEKSKFLHLLVQLFSGQLLYIVYDLIFAAACDVETYLRSKAVVVVCFPEQWLFVLGPGPCFNGWTPPPLPKSL